MRFRWLALLLGFAVLSGFLVASGPALAGIIPAPDSVLTEAPPAPAPAAPAAPTAAPAEPAPTTATTPSAAPAPAATPTASTVAPTPAAPAPRTEKVRFAKGMSGTRKVDKISGAEKVHYLLGAITGQVMKVNLTSDNPNARFNILKPEATPTDTPVFDGSKGGADFKGTLPRDGDYIIEVFLTSEAAAKNEVANFALVTAIDPLDSKVNSTAKSGWTPTPLPAETPTAAATTTAADAANSVTKSASDAVDTVSKSASDAATAGTAAVTDAASATSKAATDATAAASRTVSDASTAATTAVTDAANSTSKVVSDSAAAASDSVTATAPKP